MKKSSFVRPPLHPPIPAPPPPSVPRPQGYTAAYCHCTDGAAVRCAPSQRYLTAASGRGRQRTCASLVLLRVNSVRVKRGHEGAFQGLTSRAQRRSRGRLQRACDSPPPVASSPDAEGILSGNGRVEVPSHAPRSLRPPLALAGQVERSPGRGKEKVKPEAASRGQS